MIGIVANAQQCRVQGVVQYYHNEYLGHQPDLGAEVMFIKYSSATKVPNRAKWEEYQDMVEKWIKAAYYRKYFALEEAYESAGFKEEYKDKIQELGIELALERMQCEDNGQVKYTTLVNGTGMYDITVPYGIYYVLIKSKNRKLPTVLEMSNRYHMVRVDLKSPTQVISFDFDIPLTSLD